MKRVLLLTAWIVFMALTPVKATKEFDTPPDPTQNACRIMQNTETGEKIISDGNRWYHLGDPL